MISLFGIVSDSSWSVKGQKSFLGLFLSLFFPFCFIKEENNTFSNFLFWKHKKKIHFLCLVK
jgi:hypothetical protein